MARKKKERLQRRTDSGIETGCPVFLNDGSGAFGAVRGMSGENLDLIVNIENGGDFVIPLAAVDRVADKKVLVNWNRLPDEVRQAIRHSMDLEDYPPHEEDSEARAWDEQDDQDVRPSSLLPIVSPPGELPGRDVGSRYGAPPSITSPRRPQ